MGRRVATSGTRAGGIEGCREIAKLYGEIERECHPLEEEVEGALGG